MKPSGNVVSKEELARIQAEKRLRLKRHVRLLRRLRLRWFRRNPSNQVQKDWGHILRLKAAGVRGVRGGT